MSTNPRLLSPYALEIFPRWSILWARENELYQKFHVRLKDLLGQRNSCFTGYPVFSFDAVIPDARELIRLVENSRSKSEELPRPERRRIRKIALKLVPWVQAGIWTRWLDLENALSQCLAEDDILGSVLIGRTLIEEANRAINLQKDCIDLGKKSGASDAKLDLMSICRRFKFYALPRTGALESKQLDDVNGFSKSLKPDGELKFEEHYRRLNDYVHPNYGSHKIVVSPGECVAGVILLEALVDVYEELLSNPWLMQLKKSSLETPFNLLYEHSNYPVELIDEISEWAKENDPETLSIISDLENSYFREIDQDFQDMVIDPEPLVDIAIDIGLDEVSPSQIFSKDGGWPDQLSMPIQRFYWLLIISSAKKLSESISVQDSMEVDLSSVLGLFSQLTEFKIKVLSARTFRLLEMNCPIAACVCARAALEHHGVAVWLKKQVEKKVDRFASVSEGKAKSELGELEQLIAKCLAGTKETREEILSWKGHWDNVFGSQWVNLISSVKSLGKNAASYYNFLTAVTHGLSPTGGDLIGMPSTTFYKARAAFTIGCIMESMINRFPILASQKLDWVGGQLKAGAPFEEVQRELRMPGKLKLGRDISGDGTLARPFIFRKGLVYHQAFYKYIHDNGLKGKRERHQYSHGALDRFDIEDGESIFFLNKLSDN